MSERIDYVRLRLEGSADRRAEDVQKWEAIAAEIVERYELKNKPYDHYMLQDRMTKQWSTYFNIWGICADPFYHELEVHHFSQVTRLDYRVDLENDKLDIDAVGQWAIRNAKNKGLSSTLHSGRVKTKRRGRDTGGPSFHVGAQDTDKRISLYQRGHERPGVEAQISKQLLKNLRLAAYDASLVSSKPFHDELKSNLRTELEKLCVDRLLHPLSAFTGDSPIYAQSDMRSLQDAVYEQVSIFWALLDADERHAATLRLLDDNNRFYDKQAEGVPVVPDDTPDDYYDGENDVSDDNGSVWINWENDLPGYEA